MTVLITGATGFLGKKVRSHFAQSETVLGWHHNNPGDGTDEVDLRSGRSVTGYFDRNLFDACIHLAAMADPGSCESDPTSAHGLNVAGTQHIANACAEHNVRLIYVSTDYVFDGTAKNGYREEDEPSPLQVYGDTKLAGERIVRSVPNSLVVRIPILYGYNGDDDRSTWTQQAVAKLRNGEELEADDRQVRQPTLIDDVADALAQLLAMKETGTVHVASGEALTKFKWAQMLARMLGAHTELVKPRSDYSQTVARPMNATLRIEKMLNLGIGPLSSPVTGAERYLSDAGLLV